MDDEIVDFHILRIEVTVAAAIQSPDNDIVGGNMVDATRVFGWRLGDVPAGVSDDRINKALAEKISPVLALIQTTLTFNGWVAMDETDEPMTKHSKPTGETSRSRPTTVQVMFADEKAAVHD